MESSRPCGYPHEIFIEQPPSFCVCSICLEILRNPRQCPNGHVYCYDCIFQCMDHKKECPSCKCYLPEEVLANSLFARNMIGEMQVKCPTTVKESCVKSDLHCSWVGSINDLDDHLNHSCVSSIVPCSNVKCAVVVPRGNLVNHIASCAYSTLICPLCQGPHLRGETSSHAEKCARYTVPCRNACGAIIARIDMESHVSTCPDEMVECSYRSVGCSSDCPGLLLVFAAVQIILENKCFFHIFIRTSFAEGCH